MASRHRTRVVVRWCLMANENGNQTSGACQIVTAAPTQTSVCAPKGGSPPRPLMCSQCQESGRKRRGITIHGIKGRARSHTSKGTGVNVVMSRQRRQLAGTDGRLQFHVF